MLDEDQRLPLDLIPVRLPVDFFGWGEALKGSPTGLTGAVVVSLIKRAPLPRWIDLHDIRPADHDAVNRLSISRYLLVSAIGKLTVTTSPGLTVPA